VVPNPGSFAAFATQTLPKLGAVKSASAVAEKREQTYRI